MQNDRAADLVVTNSGSIHIAVLRKTYPRRAGPFGVSTVEPSAYGTHSTRGTKVAQIYKRTGNLQAVQLLLGQTKMDSTVRYFGVDLDDALTLSEGIDL